MRDEPGFICEIRVRQVHGRWNFGLPCRPAEHGQTIQKRRVDPGDHFLHHHLTAMDGNEVRDR